MIYLGLNLTKYVHDLLVENYKTPVKIFKKNLNKRRDLVKISILSNQIYKFNTIQLVLINYFVDIDKLILKFIYKAKQPRIANLILSKNKLGGYMLFNFKIY